ncbi:SDR family oxidoreductase [Aeromicrobium sp. Leaf350]|uniref:SDR family oxidoreductase n=1 Tax=Aeromicrobium sp. Leaf350 TaxID=2876565 RepID=UPI001E51A487|nr:SDR family oxidoreductase [Aeromicrobium sp. Leaf350]
MTDHAFVAGGTSGINLAIARAYAERGWSVSVLSRSQDKVDAALATLGEGALGYAADVRDAEAVAAAIASAAEQHGPIDALVSGAAGNFVSPAADLSPNGFRTVVEIDLLGTFNVMRGAWDHLRKPGASIVNISAAQSWLPVPGQIHVGAAKAGIDQVTRTLAMEWGPEGVRVNSVAPGPVEGTEGMRRLAPTQAAVDAWTEAVPLRRFATTDDVVNAVTWLTSPESAYVTGVVLSVDGGLALGGSGMIHRAMHAE